MKKFLLIIAAFLILLCGCTDKVALTHASSPNKTSQEFLDALYNTGFDLNMNSSKYEAAAKSIFLPNGKSLFKNGYVYAIENLQGEQYAYGEHEALIIHDTLFTDENEVLDTYRLYTKNALDGVALPCNLSFGTSFEQSLKDLNIYDQYLSARKENVKNIGILNENQETIYVSLKSWYGDITNNTAERVTAKLIFTKEQDGNTITCLLHYEKGKLVTCEYVTTVKSGYYGKPISHDKTRARLFQEPLKGDNITGTIDEIVFTEDTIELTVTLKSTTNRKEDFKCNIMTKYSIDHLGPWIQFSFTANTRKNTQTSVCKYTIDSFFNARYLALGLGRLALIDGVLCYEMVTGLDPVW